jgi:FeS assembly protein IscX
MPKTSKATNKTTSKSESKSARKLKWTDTEDIAFKLIDAYPNKDPLKLRFTDLHKYVMEIDDFGDDPKKSNEKILEAIQMRWYEERQDMEDELGPLVASTDEDTLDEDDYRDDELAVPASAVGAELFDDEEDEDDEFGDGFQKDGEDEDDER